MHVKKLEKKNIALKCTYIYKNISNHPKTCHQEATKHQNYPNIKIHSMLQEFALQEG